MALKGLAKILMAFRELTPHLRVLPISSAVGVGSTPEQRAPWVLPSCAGRVARRRPAFQPGLAAAKGV